MCVQSKYSLYYSAFILINILTIVVQVIVEQDVSRITISVVVDVPFVLIKQVQQVVQCGKLLASLSGHYCYSVVLVYWQAGLP